MKNYLKNQIIYQCFPRNFSASGNFLGVVDKLDYIASLGTDILYLTPISPIGKKGRKGSLGSPYAISDYEKINPEYGTLENFKNLIEKVHLHKMKLMIDIVFNHTSRDSRLLKDHPEWFFRDRNGNFANKVGDRSDVYDLEYRGNPKLIEYLVGVIEKYLSYGVDGFRFDVASLLPEEFYIALKRMIDAKYPETILLAESVDPGFCSYVRSLGYNALSDAELAKYFDLLYGYDTFNYLRDYLTKGNEYTLYAFKTALHLEESTLPSSAMRIRGLENHDTPRIIEYAKTPILMRNLAAYPLFLKGPGFIYNGMESKADHHPTLFDKDLINMDIDRERFDYLLGLLKVKKNEKNLELLTSEVALNGGELIIVKNTYKDSNVEYGLFNLAPQPALYPLEWVEKGTYVDEIGGKKIEINGKSILLDEPLYLKKAS
jgi:cyclomaltodextrinase